MVWEGIKNAFLEVNLGSNKLFLGKNLTFSYTRKISWDRLFKLDFKEWIVNDKDKGNNIQKENSRKPGRLPTNLLSVPPDPISQAHPIEHLLQPSLIAAHSSCEPHRPFYLPNHPLLLCTGSQFQQAPRDKPREAPLKAGNKQKREPTLSYGSWNPVHPVSPPAL